MVLILVVGMLTLHFSSVSQVTEPFGAQLHVTKWSELHTEYFPVREFCS